MEFSGVEAPAFQDVAQTVGTALRGPRGLHPFRALGPKAQVVIFKCADLATK